MSLQINGPVQIYHLGIWFNSPADAVKAGCPGTATTFTSNHDAGIQVLNTATFPAAQGPTSHNSVSRGTGVRASPCYKTEGSFRNPARLAGFRAYKWLNLSVARASLDDENPIRLNVFVSQRDAIARE